MKNILLIVLAIIVVLGGIYIYHMHMSMTAPSTETATSTTETSTSAAQAPAAAPRAAVSSTFSWNFTTLPEKAGVPSTKVTLVDVTSRKNFDVGTYDGSCSVIGGSSAWKLLKGEVSGAICYFAGGGSEIGVFISNGHHIASVGSVDEGSAETGGSRGNFKTLLVLD